MSEKELAEVRWLKISGHDFYEVSTNADIRFDSAMTPSKPEWVPVEKFRTINGFDRVDLADPITEESCYLYTWEILIMALRFELHELGIYKTIYDTLRKSSGRYTGDSNIKIPDEEIARMRSLFEGPANMGIGELARMYDLNKGYISRIVNGKVRKDVDSRLADAYTEG